MEVSREKKSLNPMSDPYLGYCRMPGRGRGRLGSGAVQSTTRRAFGLGGGLEMEGWVQAVDRWWCLVCGLGF